MWAGELGSTGQDLVVAVEAEESLAGPLRVSAGVERERAQRFLG